MNGKNNGHDKNADVIHFPTQKQRDKLKKEQEKRLQAQYKAERKNQREPFFNLERISPFVRIYILCLLGFNIPFFLLSDSGTKLSLIYTLGFMPARFTGEYEWSWLALATPLTHLIVHSDWMHLLINTTMGTVLGLFFEKLFGLRKTLVFFLSCCLGGLIVYMLLNPFSPQPLIGASGGISGLFGGMLWTILKQIENEPRYYSSTSIVNGQHALRQRVSSYMKKKGPWPILILWGVLMTAFGMLGGDHIAWSAHLGGYITGITYMIFIQKGTIKP